MAGNQPTFNFGGGGNAGGFNFGGGAPAGQQQQPPQGQTPFTFPTHTPGGIPLPPLPPLPPPPPSVFTVDSPAARMLMQFYERYQRGEVGDNARARTVYRRLDPETLKKDESKEKADADADDDEEVDESELPTERFQAQWDSAFALCGLLENSSLNDNAGGDDDAAAVTAPIPQPLVYTLAFLLSVRCVQCGSCDIENCVLLTRGRGALLCRRMPLCGPCVRSSRLAGRMIMAQTAAPAYPLRSDETTERYLQDADSFIVNDPFLLQFVSHSPAIKNCHTVRYCCQCPDVDLLELSENAKNLQHLVYGGNTVGHPEVIGDLVSKDLAATLRTLEICTGPMLPWTLKLLLERQPASLESLTISRHRSRNDRTDAADFEAESLVDITAAAPAQPKLRRFVVHLGIGYHNESANSEEMHETHFERLAGCAAFSTLDELRLHVPMAASCDEAKAAACFEKNEKLTNLRLHCINAGRRDEEGRAGDGDDVASAEPSGCHPPPNCLELTVNAIFPPKSGGNDTLRTLALTRIKREEADALPQLRILPQFTNLRTLTIRVDKSNVNEDDVKPLDQLVWLETVVLIGDLIFALEPVSRLKRVTEVVLDYSPPAFRNDVRPALLPPDVERYNWINVQTLTRMTQLKKLSIRGLGAIDIIKPELFDGSFQLSRLELVSCDGVGDDEVCAAVKHNEGLEVVAMSDLKKLSNCGIAALEDLLYLRDLAVLRCPHVTERGLLRVAERCRALQTTALEAGTSDTYVADSVLNKLAARAQMSLKFPDLSIGYSVSSTDSKLL